MKAIQFTMFGDPDVLKYVEAGELNCNDDQVLVRTQAVGINRIDCKIREGSSFVSEQLKNHLPSSLGYEFSGEIVALGKKIRQFKVGDQVMGAAGFPNTPCCYAEYITTSEDLIIKKPMHLDFLQAATLPLAGLTALQALNLTEVQSGDRVLVQAGSGGVGHLAVQLAKLKGATVITTASKENHAYLTELGVDHCIDYHSEDFTKAITEPVDVVIDLIGGQVGILSLDVLSSSGRMVTVPTITAEEVIAAGKKNQRDVVGIVMQFNMKALAYLAALVAEKKLFVEIYKSFHLADAASAHRLLESGGVKRGKLGLIVN